MCFGLSVNSFRHPIVQSETESEEALRCGDLFHFDQTLIDQLNALVLKSQNSATQFSIEFFKIIPSIEKLVASSNELTQSLNLLLDQRVCWFACVPIPMLSEHFGISVPGFHSFGLVFHEIDEPGYPSVYDLLPLIKVIKHS